MTTSSVAHISPAAARNCFLINQFATPGLGSLMAKRYISGLGQLLLSVAGFLLVMIWFVLTLKEVYSLMYHDAPARSYARFAGAGVLTFAVAWTWSLFTSLSVIRDAKRHESIPEIPPRIS
jgi:hypothetical protein